MVDDAREEARCQLTAQQTFPHTLTIHNEIGMLPGPVIPKLGSSRAAQRYQCPLGAPLLGRTRPSLDASVFRASAVEEGEQAAALRFGGFRGGLPITGMIRHLRDDCSVSISRDPQGSTTNILLSDAQLT